MGSQRARENPRAGVAWPPGKEDDGRAGAWIGCPQPDHSQPNPTGSLATVADRNLEPSSLGVRLANDRSLEGKRFPSDRRTLLGVCVRRQQAPRENDGRELDHASFDEGVQRRVADETTRTPRSIVGSRVSTLGFRDVLGLQADYYRLVGFWSLNAQTGAGHQIGARPISPRRWRASRAACRSSCREPLPAVAGIPFGRRRRPAATRN